MTTKNPRINVTFEKNTAVLLTHLAAVEYTSVANIVRTLACEALEMREDLYLSKLAEKLDKPGAKTRKHKDVWK
jgi:hypothetical protein